MEETVGPKKLPNNKSNGSAWSLKKPQGTLRAVADLTVSRVEPGAEAGQSSRATQAIAVLPASCAPEPLSSRRRARMWRRWSVTFCGGASFENEPDSMEGRLSGAGAPPRFSAAVSGRSISKRVMQTVLTQTPSFGA
jgi:hypothetical protein